MLQISINYNSLKLIKTGAKLYEIRVKRGIFNKISGGDTIKLYNKSEIQVGQTSVGLDNRMCCILSENPNLSVSAPIR